MSSVIIHLDRSALDLSLALQEIDARAYAVTLLVIVRQELPVLAPLSERAVLSLFDCLPPAVAALVPDWPIVEPLAQPIELAPRAAGAYTVLDGLARLALARDQGVARLPGRVHHLGGEPELVWVIVQPDNFTVEPR